MKLLAYIVTIALFFLTSNPVIGQIYILGNGVTSNNSNQYPAPYGNFWFGAKNQFVYYASELIAAGATAGPITQLGFNITSINSGNPLSDFNISIKNTSTSNLTSWETGLSTVYYTSSYAPVTGWNIHQLSTPFNWEGTSNIIIETCFNNVGPYTNNESTEWTTGFSDTVSIYYTADHDSVCTGNFTPSYSTSRPNLKFGNQLADDIGLTSLNGLYSGCHLGNNEVVSVSVSNFGTAPQSNFSITYQINNGPLISETFSSVLNPGDTLSYTFSTTADLSSPGAYIFDAYTNLLSSVESNTHIIWSLTSFKIYMLCF